MKIEKISENQIRCTLNSTDLSERHINLGELAYGSDKAKELFRDMMQQAFNDFGFDVDDNPLMVEAIPMGSDSIVLVITKVDDPEELDTRFSRFSPTGEDDASSAEDFLPILEGADSLKTGSDSGRGTASDSPAEKSAEKPAREEKRSRIYEFRSIDVLSEAAEVISPFFDGKNTLYRNRDNKLYYLVISGQGYPFEIFSRVLNTLSEFGKPAAGGYAREAYIEEHFEKIIDGIALQVLRTL